MARDKRLQKYRELEQSRLAGKPVRIRVSEANSGGLVVHVTDHRGASAFLPSSHVGLERVADLGSLVGEEFEVLVESCDVEKGKAVVSRRRLLLARREESMSRALSRVRMGDVLDGTVTSVSERGIFVDAGDLHGIVVRYGMSWELEKKAEETRSPGEAVKARIVRLDHAKQQVAFDIRETDPDPWIEHARTHHVGELVFGRAVAVHPHCAYFEISPGVYGFAHVRELTEVMVRGANDVVSPGDEMWLKICGHDPRARYERIAMRMFNTGRSDSTQRRSAFSHVNADGHPKWGYGSHADADLKIDELVSDGYRGAPLYSYLCDTCGMWHFGAVAPEFWTLSKVRAEAEGGELAVEWRGKF